MFEYLILQKSHNSLLEKLTAASLLLKPNTELGKEISFAIMEGEQIKNSVATTTES